MIERIGGHLDYLSKYGSKVFQKSVDVQKARSLLIHLVLYLKAGADLYQALAAAYCDLLGFFVAVKKVFTNKEGRSSC